ncbi:Hermansky-Pudlak syndrome 5 protein [Manacus vitellinus]|uniref:Hermansky-Pudlak syndrome 5 protein homolog n=1 Tax=Manacus vitellinus TaxID=328815 RepID=A0A093PYW8_9PASS|nr:Hermansky-Pudlak syndrome 5 protein [Manacus vitellinus]
MASVPVIPDSYNHVLAELECLDPLLSALRLDSSRLKCTCIDVSKRWLALGSSGGGLNLIQKDGWKQRLFLTHKEGAISRVACCLHDEDYVAVATSQGLVVVWELNQERRGKPERIYVSSEHKGRKVTALCWDTAALRVFVGDHVGKVSAIKINTSKQGKAAATFVMFPVQIITTVDSRVVQLDYLDGRLLISSLTHTYLCDTERQVVFYLEKFWKIGNKERDGEFGACFFPVGKNSGNQQPLIYCARPGSRMWEVNFDGEVQSTHQFKQLLSSPPLPVVTLRQDPHYTGSSCSPQSLSFPKLLYLTEHCVVTWTERGIYIFLPQSVQVLLWSEVKDIQDIAVYKSELFCLHTNGKVVHLSLLLVDRCVERLMRRGFWTLAARVSCLFQNSIISCRARKNLPLDKLEHLKSQLDASTQQDLTMQLEELISKLEPLDSACSSRRSSISSHESFSVLDSGIYRVISRRGSQSDEDSCSLHSQTFSEDERLKQFPAHQEDEQVDLDNVCHASVVVEADRNETFLPFSIPLSFRSPSPLVQAVKESVSSFVRKTTEKIGTLHISPDTKGRQEAKDDEQLPELTANLVASPQEEKELEPQSCQLPEEDRLRDLKAATAEALAKLQDPQILLEPQCMRRVLQEWLVYLEEKFSSKDHSALSSKKSKAVCAEEQRAVVEENLRLGPADGDPVDKEQSSVVEGCIEKGNTDETCVSKTMCENSTALRGPLDCGFQVSPLCVLEPDVQKDLVDLTTLCFELRVFPCGSGDAEEGSDGSLPLAAVWTLACRFMRRYFFLLDLKRVKQCIITTYATSPNVWETYIAGLKELTCHSPVALAMESEDMLKVLKLLHDLGPWDDSPLLLVHAQRLYEKFGEMALRPLIKFYPSILPSDIKQLCRNDPAHFLAYLDSLVKSKPEDKRPSLLRSLLQPESLRLDWLCLAVSHDAPQRANTVDAEGNPRPRSHLFTWGYSQLILLLIKLPADFATKEKMAHICKSHGFWPGYLFLCLELDRRIEAFTNIAHLDDLSLLNGEDGCIPETIEEWKFLLHLAQNHSTALHHHGQQNGNAVSNGGTSCPDCITVENVALLLARAIGPNRALPLLQECGLTPELSERFTGVCEILRIAEKRQRALIQSMLERCDRFLWSQQA